MTDRDHGTVTTRLLLAGTEQYLVGTVFSWFLRPRQRGGRVCSLRRGSLY